jgi:hypothetical protein
MPCYEGDEIITSKVKKHKNIKFSQTDIIVNDNATNYYHSRDAILYRKNNVLVFDKLQNEGRGYQPYQNIFDEITIDENQREEFTIFTREDTETLFAQNNYFMSSFDNGNFFNYIIGYQNAENEITIIFIENTLIGTVKNTIRKIQKIIVNDFDIVNYSSDGVNVNIILHSQKNSNFTYGTIVSDILNEGENPDLFFEEVSSTINYTSQAENQTTFENPEELFDFTFEDIPYVLNVSDNNIVIVDGNSFYEFDFGNNIDLINNKITIDDAIQILCVKSYDGNNYVVSYIDNENHAISIDLTTNLVINRSEKPVLLDTENKLNTFENIADVFIGVNGKVYFFVPIFENVVEGISIYRLSNGEIDNEIFLEDINIIKDLSAPITHFKIDKFINNYISNRVNSVSDTLETLSYFNNNQKSFYIFYGEIVNTNLITTIG